MTLSTKMIDVATIRPEDLDKLREYKPDIPSDGRIPLSDLGNALDAAGYAAHHDEFYYGKGAALPHRSAEATAKRVIAEVVARECGGISTDETARFIDDFTSKGGNFG